MVTQNSHSYPARMLNLEYTALVPSAALRDAVCLALSRPSRLAGFSVEEGHVVMTDLVTRVQARAICDIPGMLRVLSPVSFKSITRQMVDRLIGRRVIDLRPFVAKARIDEVKPFKPAREVLAAHLADEEFLKLFEVLPEALAGADTCKFRNDGSLDRYLANLKRFAKDALDPANFRKPLGFLAKNNGLTHFAEGIGMTATQKYPEDYTAVYQGAARIFPMHVTIGAGHHEEDCMSIHFLVDRAAGKLVIARFGRHGRGAISKN